MDARSIENWPIDFAALEQRPPEGWAVLPTVLDPLLLIRRTNSSLTATLAARLSRRRGTVLLSAPSLRCNWVAGEGVICALPRDVVAFVQAKLAGVQADRLTFPEALALHHDTTSEIAVEIDPSVLVSANEAAGAFSPAVIIPELHAELFPYQARGIAWMQDAISRTGGVVLADEMGLGKTLQVIGLLLLNPPTRDNPALVVCPTTLIANWERELARFAPSLDVIVHRGTNRARLHRELQRSRVLVTTYDTLVNDLVIFEAVEWAWLICDEAQAIKNPESKRRVAVGALHRLRTIPVTGTPVENHLLDLWSLVDAAIPGLLGDRPSFELRFPDTEDAARELAAITNPVVLKRKVLDVAKDLPERMDIAVPLELGPELAERYEKVRLDTIAKYSRAGAMVATGQLQLFCAHPSLSATDVARPGWEDNVSAGEDRDPCPVTPKIQRTVDLIEEAFANTRKILLFANFNACGPIIRQAAKSVPRCYWGAINGTTPSALRQEIVDEFTRHDGPGILILNPRAAGAGLNITAATIVIHYTQVWNPALELQASARAHRRGQTRPVSVYHMYYVNTVEEIMMERAARRRELGHEAVPTTTQEKTDLGRALSISPVGGQ